MDDAGGNSQEQLGSVEEQIRVAEECIRRVEEQDEKCSDDQEKKQLRGKEVQLRGKEAQLRDREAQLRDREAQLRDREAQLLQERDLGTEHDWLVQEVVVLDVPSEPRSYPSCSTKVRMYNPLKVEHWDVKGEIEEFLRKADRKKRAYRVFVMSSTRIISETAKLEGVVVANIMSEMQHFMKQKQPQLKFRFSPQVALGSKLKKKDKADETDETGSEKGNPNCRCEVFGITAAHGERLIRCISQLYEYMALSEVGYVILIDARNWYLFKRDNAGCLKVSVGFKAGGGHPPVLAALSYLVDIASKDSSKFGKGPGHGETPRLHGAAPSEPSSESADDVKNDPDFRGRGSSISGSERPRSTRSRSDGSQLALKDVSAVDLSLKLTGSIISCEGWSGCVAMGRLYGQAVALKFAFLNTERAEALLEEIVAYQKMEKLRGGFVPRLIGYGTTCNEQAVFVATELIDGVELGEGVKLSNVEPATLLIPISRDSCSPSMVVL